MHYFADRLQAGPFERTYMLGYEQMMRKKSIKSRKYRRHSPSKRQNILIFHQNPLQHPISSLSACHVIIYCDLEGLNCISHIFSHCSRLARSVCMTLLSVNELITRYKAVLSVKSVTLDFDLLM